MISVHRLDHSKFIINAEQIETVEETPDTVITLLNGNRYVVRDNAGDILDRVMEYKCRISLGKSE